MDLRRRAFEIGWAVHRALFRVSRGRFGTRRDRGRRGVGVLVLTTIGRRSGEPRRTPLFYVADAGRLLVVPSNAGSDTPPAWWLNLQARPAAEVEIGRDAVAVRAREASSEEAERLWPVLTQRYEGWERYRREVRRELPIVVLEPTSATR